MVVKNEEPDLKEEGQEYGQILKLCGDGRADVFCFDGEKRMCKIKGSLKKHKIWIQTVSPYSQRYLTMLLG